MSLIFQVLFLVVTYAVAAIPFGLVLAKIFAKKDIRQHGSKNIGATNVARVLGKKLGLVTLILDGLKGAVMVIIARVVFSDLENLQIFLVVVAAIAVVAHVYPIYLNFKGGKGVATAIAVLVAIDPLIGVLAICVWLTLFYIFRTSSISSLSAVFSSIILSAALGAEASQIYFCCFLTLLITIRHKENIARLISGEEKKF
jgi:glycerol-3-phosphate acyltransferase PlsY